MTPQLQPTEIRPGYGLSPVPLFEITDLTDLYDLLLIWEPPDPRRETYIMSVDVAGGIGLDRSCIDITRIPSIRRPAEQVAQFVSPNVDPLALAYVCDAVGRYYRGADNLSALAAVECNGMGMGTQLELHQHLGYDNIFVWRYLDEADLTKQTTKLGWYTTTKSRPQLIAKYVKKVKRIDSNTNIPDYIINSPFTADELRDFTVIDMQKAHGLWDAEAATGAFDDCIMAGAIGVYIADLTNYEFSESVDDQRRRLSEESARRHKQAEVHGGIKDFRNTDWDVDEVADFSYYSPNAYDDGMSQS